MYKMLSGRLVGVIYISLGCEGHGNFCVRKINGYSPSNSNPESWSLPSVLLYVQLLKCVYKEYINCGCLPVWPI